MNRFLGAGAAALFALVFAFPASAEKLVELKHVFVHLDAYLRTPPAARSRFTLIYRVGRPGGGGVPGLKVWIVEGARRTPLALGPDGQPERLPTLDEFTHARLAFDVPPTTRLAVSMALEPVDRPAPEMDAQSLALAASQATAAIRKAEGPIGMAVPAFDQVYFSGVTSGEAVWPDGRRRPLELRRGELFFDTSAGRGVRTLRFPHAPARVEIGPK